MTILPITYLGGTEYFSCLAAGDQVIDIGENWGGNDCSDSMSLFQRNEVSRVCIDIGENWVKQTVRNRCEILTSRGVTPLTVPVHAAGSTKDIRIDNSKRWQHVHWQSIVSAYSSSPFFNHYEGLFVPIFRERKHEFLLDLDLQLTELVLAILKLPMPRISENYVTSTPDDLDLRDKRSLRRESRGVLSDMSQPYTTTRLRPYTQVFSDRLPFEPGLSIIDLIFCEGPEAKNYISV